VLESANPVRCLNMSRPAPSGKSPTTVPRPGERAIAEAGLEALPNPARQREYIIHFSYPEFTCKCPMTGYPDFAVIDIWIVPAQSIIELKSLKLYLNRYRDTYAFHEDVTNGILDDIVEAAQPTWARIVGDWNPRGNLKTVITAEHNADNRPEFWDSPRS